MTRSVARILGGQDRPPLTRVVDVESNVACPDVVVFSADRDHLGRHYRTGEPPPTSLLDRLHKSKSLFAAMGVRTQLLYAVVDQRLFGPQVN